MLRRYSMLFAMAMPLIAGVWADALAQTEEEIRATWQGIMDALNAHDVDQYLSYLTDDVVIDWAPAPSPANGKEEVAALVAGFQQGFPDIHFNPQRILTSGNILVCEYIVTGTHQEDWMGIPATGKSFQSLNFDIMEYEGDKVKRATCYWDNAILMVQLGVMPASELPSLEPSFTLPDAEATGLSPLEAEVEAQSRWNTHDLALYAKIVHPHAEVLIAPLGATLDRNGYIASQELYFLAFPDVRMEPVRLIDMGDGWVVSEVLFRATNDGPYFGIPATGRPVELRGAWIARYDADGLITNLNIYFDNMTILVQLGVVEPPQPTAISPASWGEIKAMFR